MYPSGNLFIPATHGRLEAILKEPKVQPARGVALVLHPHPLHGGTMHSKVVFRSAAALNDAGLVALRMNFRGVGHSTGEHDKGVGEKDDVAAALAFIEEEFPGMEVTLAGFSFGSRVGLDVGIRDHRVVRLIGIGTPVDMYDFSFLKECRKPILFVHGSDDEFGSPTRLRAIASMMPSESGAQVEVIEGAGHFFYGHLDELKTTIREWAKNDE